MNYHAADHTLIISSHLHFVSSPGWTTWMGAIVSPIRITHNNGMDPTLLLQTKIYVARSTSRTWTEADFYVENFGRWKMISTLYAVVSLVAWLFINRNSRSSLLCIIIAIVMRWQWHSNINFNPKFIANWIGSNPRWFRINAENY